MQENDYTMADITEIQIAEAETLDLGLGESEEIELELDEFEYSVDKVGVSNALIDVKVDKTTIEAISKTLVFEQAIPSNIWEIQHNLNKYPSVSIVDSAGSIVIGDVLYVDENFITITFSGGFSGKAYLN